jgi:membrane peptidoglycan carboxypeptidase
MEIYFNVIEFGPGIYGIGRATRHYFGKTPRDLVPQEAAFFSSILPNPKRRYVQFCRKEGTLDTKWQNYVNRILRRMHERKRLTDDEYQKAITTPVVFSRTEAMTEKECLALVKRLTTPTMPVMDISK